MSVGPKVSVCVVTYNHERYIQDCLMSVIAQSADVTLEILVRDDCSDDSTAKIIHALSEAYPGLIRYFRPEKRHGRGADNTLFLVAEARGEYIAHLDGDDAWMPGKLRQQVEFLQQNQDCCAVYTNALAIEDQGALLGLFNNRQPEVFNLGYLLRGGSFLNHSSILYRTEMREQVLSIPADLFFDYRMHLAFACQGSLGYLNQALTIYRVASSGSMIVNANERIRRLYWASLLSLPADKIDRRDLGLGMSQFMRSIFFRAVRLRSFSLLKEWWPRVLDAAPVGRVQMVAWACLAIVRVGCNEIASRACARLTGNTLKIMYRR